MGIHGVYKEIGPGDRIALSKLAVQKFEETGRPLRIAIDVSIWLFQIQAGKGGTNPALRTFYYRLLRLIALNIHPVFVFDGPNKPPFKRNKRTGPNVASIPEFLAKQLLKQFGFPIHLAPGEAEAECALLQKEGIVDAVLSEDVDSLMFGSGVLLRNWSPDQNSKGKTPTHISMYDAARIKHGPSKLDPAGMILIGLMSGGDYIPEGIPGCGPKTACEAARAGFGRDLCKIPRNDAQGFEAWRERLRHELRTNESKFFRTKHKSLVIPDDFPRRDILGYYTHPVVSSKAALDRLQASIKWDQELDFPGLREFAKDAFDWAKISGAKHFIRCLAPSLLMRELRKRGENSAGAGPEDPDKIQEEESKLVKGIHGKRQHAITDHTTEIRVSFTPIDLVKIDLDVEEPDDEPPELDSDEELPELDEDGPKKRGPVMFDPTKPDRVWVLETYVKVGIPLKVQDWEAGVRPKKVPATKKATTAGPKAPKAGARRTKTTGGMQKGVLDAFTKVTKPGLRPARAKDVASTSAATRTKSAPSSTSCVSSPPRAQPTTVAVIDLLSSPAKPITSTAAAPPRAVSPTPDRSSSTVTKRARHGLARRTHTLPVSGSETPDRQATPQHESTIETLDLVSPMSPSPRFPVKKAKTAATKEQAPSAAANTLLSPSTAHDKQSTLDSWSRSASKPRQQPMRNTQPIPSKSIAEHFQPSRTQQIEQLDLTMEPAPVFPKPQRRAAATSIRPTAPKTNPRPALRSISSNASQASTESNTSTRNGKVQLKPPSPLRRSPRINKSAPAPEPETLDLTILSSPHAAPMTGFISQRTTTEATNPRISRLSSPQPEPLLQIPTIPSIPSDPPSPSPRRSPRLHHRRRQIRAPPSSSMPAHPLTCHFAVSKRISASPRPEKAIVSALPLPEKLITQRKDKSKKRCIVLSKYRPGLWEWCTDSSSSGDEEDEEEAGGFVKERMERVGGKGGKGDKDKMGRRKWRESDVGVVDLT